MTPSLKPNQLVLVTVWIRRLYIGDVIVFKHDDKEKIKRIRRIDGEKFQVEGDNPDSSTDSRSFGSIDKSQVIGKLIWPRV